jgi:cytochrome c553
MTLRRVLLAAALGAAAVAAAAADRAAGRDKAQACVGCHGQDGISRLPETPSLAAQPDNYLQWQLVYFRSETRKVAVMNAVTSALSDAEIRNLGAYYSSLPPPKPPEQPDEHPDLTRAGALLARQHRCAKCHTATFAGQDAIARIADQQEQYLLKALRDFKSGARTGGGVAAMPDAVYSLSDDDLKALAHFLARFR